MEEVASAELYILIFNPMPQGRSSILELVSEKSSCYYILKTQSSHLHALKTIYLVNAEIQLQV